MTPEIVNVTPTTCPGCGAPAEVRQHDGTITVVCSAGTEDAIEMTREQVAEVAHARRVADAIKGGTPIAEAVALELPETPYPPPQARPAAAAGHSRTQAGGGDSAGRWGAR